MTPEERARAIIEPYLDWAIAENLIKPIAAAIREAVMEEREENAKIAETNWAGRGDSIATLIREREDQP